MKKWVIGNWKLYGSRSFMSEYVNEFVAALSAAGLKASTGDDVCLALCPPACYTLALGEVLSKHVEPLASSIAVGVQHICTVNEGAFTGEIAAEMAKDCGAALSLIGHSERRQLFGETDDQVAVKVKTVLAAGLTPVLCVGETLVERQEERTLAVIERQLRAALGGLTAADWSRLVVAYEPVWAIGTGHTATPAQAQSAHAFIRETLGALQQEQQMSSVQPISILYGGSVKEGNSAELMAQPDVDGVLVGGASLKPAEFAKIALSAR